ncbi:MAG: XRE family transcriptional regulator [Dehalococcoidia bacterium]|nr:MAG: XRE family transcriptional regulator [Dehalococcoidia bacterium]
MLLQGEARVTADNRNDLGKMLKQRRVIIPLTLTELSAMSGVSSSHLGRIERGKRFPSAYTLRKIANPLGFDEGELFTYAGYLPPQPSPLVEGKTPIGRLDPYVAEVLSREPLEVQRTVLLILLALKCMVTGIAQRN